MESEPRFFLHELFGNKPEELHLLLWTLTDKRSRWFRDVDEAATAVEDLRDQDVYVGVGLSPEDFGPRTAARPTGSPELLDSGPTWI